MPRSSVDPSVAILRYFADAPLPAAQTVLALVKYAVGRRVEAEAPPKPQTRGKAPARKKATLPGSAPTMPPPQQPLT